MGTGIDPVYRERAHLVAHLAAAYPSSIGYADPSEPEWAVVVVNLPTGQVTWHVAPSDMDLFEHVHRGAEGWDGHTTEEKYARLDAHTRALAQREG
ncbi:MULTISPECIES: WDGH domain-containing protein [Streptomyces]|uniref:WDGH domain-containing protein n=1 Tax=Streptomyces TaxID=1883 RepID=UPI0033D97DAC